MSLTSSIPVENLDKTFRTYDSQQAASYAKYRSQTYSSRLYEINLDHHNRTGGQFDTLLDVGCGTGAAARGLAPEFQHATGVDPGEAMISQAIEMSGRTASGERIRYEVMGAEELHKLQSVKEGKVDLLVAAMAVGSRKRLCHKN
jgi:predicted TPR repeat methyltransferase